MASTGLGQLRRRKRVRHKRRKLEYKLCIRVDDKTMDKILAIQEKLPGWEYSTYLRPVILDAIDKMYQAVVKHESS